MADAKETASKTYIVVIAVFAAAVVLVSIAYFAFTPRGGTQPPEERVEREPGEPTTESRRDQYAEGMFTGEVTASERGEVIDSLSRGLVLVDYSYERGAEAVDGSIMNNSRQPYVDVEVGFHLLDAQEDSVGLVRDTLPEIGPGHTQRFSISMPPDEAVTSVAPARLTAVLRDVTGVQRDPNYQQNEYPVPRPGQNGDDGAAADPGQQE